MDNEETNEELTPEEEEMVERDDISGEEAHRAGEFDDLRDRMERLQSTMNDIRDEIRDMLKRTEDSVSELIEGGAVVTEAPVNADDVVVGIDSLDDTGFVKVVDDLDLDFD